jgi:hypothetical protein
MWVIDIKPEVLGVVDIMAERFVSQGFGEW